MTAVIMKPQKTSTGGKMTNKHVSRYPKALADAETTPRNRHAAEIVLYEDGITEAKVKELHQTVFQLVGAYPYFFDVINYACTQNPEKIERKDNPRETHYRAAIPWNIFKDYALDGHTDAGNTKRLSDELYKMIDHPLSKVLPLDKNHSIRTQPIRLDIVYEDNILYSQIRGLKNVDGRKIKGIIIEFYKPLWRSLFDGKYGINWFLAPKAFNAKMHVAIEKHKEEKEFTAYGTLAYAIDYRRLFLYLNMHDNKRGEHVNYDALDLARSCIPSQVRLNEKGEYELINWYHLHQFVQKVLLLLNRMGHDGFMEGIPFIPKSVWYEKPTKEIKVRFHRDMKMIPNFTNEAPFLPNGERIRSVETDVEVSRNGR
jgi:hypothetical protein